MNRNARWVAWVAGAGMLALFSEATACGNSTRGHGMRMRGIELDEMAMAAAPYNLQEERLIPHLSLAEDALREGKYVLASSELESVFTEVAQSSARMRSRFERVAALLSVRTAGQWPLRKPGIENAAGARARVLEDAVNKLRKRLLATPKDPIARTDLGEALAATPKNHKEAKRILEELAARDLLTSAHGYAALSRLRSLAKDEKGAAAALSACQKLDEKALVCPVPAAPKA